MPRVQRSLRTLQLLALIATVTLISAPASALAQRGFESDPIDDSSQLRRAGSIVKNWVRRPNNNPAEAKQFENYFDNYYFPSMTLATPEGLGNLGKLRADLFRQYIDPATPDVRRKLTQKAFEFASRVIRNKNPQGKSRRYHRSVQYNAVLILGGLTTDGTTPLPRANDFLCRIAAIATQKKLQAYMLAGAIVKLSEHAQKLDTLPEPNQRLTLTTLAAATKAEAVSTTADPGAQNWLRRRAAIGMLTGAKKIGKSASAATLLLALVADESLSLESRAAIASNLEGVDLPANGNAAKAILELAAEVSATELDEATAFEKMRIGGRGSRGRRGRRDSGTFSDSQRYRFNAAESRMEYVREGLAALLIDLKKGLKASQATAGNQAASVQSAVRAIDDVLNVATSPDTIDLDVAAAIKTMAQEITQVAPGAPSEETAEENLF